MTTKTKRALLASIKHWERMRDGKEREGEFLNSNSCALCDLFLNQNTPYDEWCEGCPIAERTGEILCRDTPYNKAHDAWMDQVTNVDGYKAWFKAANDMIAFLRSLLPKEKGKR